VIFDRAPIHYLGYSFLACLHYTANQGTTAIVDAIFKPIYGDGRVVVMPREQAPRLIDGDPCFPSSPRR
jgi:hypothetical protein